MRLRGRMGVALAAVALMVVLGAAGARSAPPGGRGTIALASFRSRALGGTAHYSVYLPPGYSTSTTRYPVVYFLHGLPAGADAYKSIAWVARAVESSGHKAIVIGAEGARAGESDDEWLDRGSGRNWETATAQELVAVVDSRYRTVAARAGRTLIGISAGGYGAALIGFHHPETYSAVESWSGYFEPTNPAGTAVLDLGSAASNRRASLPALVPALRARRAPTRFAFYVGAADTRFRADNERLYRELRANGIADVTFRVYPGGHSTALWQSHAAAWIGLAFAPA